MFARQDGSWDARRESLAAPQFASLSKPAAPNAIWRASVHQRLRTSATTVAITCAKSSPASRPADHIAANTSENASLCGSSAIAVLSEPANCVIPARLLTSSAVALSRNATRLTICPDSWRPIPAILAASNKCQPTTPSVINCLRSQFLLANDAGLSSRRVLRQLRLPLPLARSRPKSLLRPSTRRRLPKPRWRLRLALAQRAQVRAAVAQPNRLTP